MEYPACTIEEYRKQNAKDPPPPGGFSVNTCYNGLTNPRQILSASSYIADRMSCWNNLLNLSFVLVGIIMLVFHLSAGGSWNDFFTGKIVGIFTLIAGVTLITDYCLRWLATPGIKYNYENEFLDGQPVPGWFSQYGYTDIFRVPWEDLRSTFKSDQYHRHAPKLPIPAVSGFVM